MKIWIIGRNYPNKKNKMCGSFELEQAKMFAKNGHNVSYIACVFHPLYKVKKWGFCEWNEDVHIYAYSQPYLPQRLNFYWDSFKERRWTGLLKRVEQETGVPDVIHLHYPTLLSVPGAILAYKKRGTKVVVTEHWTKVQSGNLNRHELGQLTAYVGNADHFICVGEPLKSQIITLTHSQREINVVPNIVPELFKCSTDKHEDFRFIAVGRLVPVKQFEKIIKAFSQCFRGKTDVTLTIVGGGSQFGKLKKQINALGVSKQVCLTGALSRKETAEYISNSNVLVSFSRLETFGVPIIEAWYCGIPTIATDAIGFKNYWNESLGEIVSYKDFNALCKSMIRIKDEYNKYSKEYIRNYAKEYFSETAVYNQLISLYEQ